MSIASSAFRWVLAAAPTLVFVATNGLTSLVPALWAAGATAVVTSGYLVVRRERRRAAVGLLLVAAGAGVAAVTGEARGFFLLPALVPFVVVTVCLGSVLVRRPLTGLVLNRLAGGPPDWYDHRPLLGVHVAATLVCAAVNIVNAVLQVVFYLADDPAVLAAVHLATGPLFATIASVTVVRARRARGGRAPDRGATAGCPAPAPRR